MKTSQELIWLSAETALPEHEVLAVTKDNRFLSGCLMRLSDGVVACGCGSNALMPIVAFTAKPEIKEK